MLNGVIFLSMLVGWQGWATIEDKPTVFGAHYGYVLDVDDEKNRLDVEMEMLEQPPPVKTLNETIFTEKLSKEFQTQYSYRFGQTQSEQVLNTPGRDDEYTYRTGETVTLQEYQKYQKKFAEYMGRRLVEFHVDQWAKNDPDFRPVYAAKDRVSNLSVQTKSGYKFRWKYNFSGPNMDFQLQNPHDLEVKVRVEMNGVMSSPSETIYTVGYPINHKVHILALCREQDGVYQLVGTRRLTKKMSTSLTGSVDTRTEGPTVKQNLVLVGLSWSD